MADTHDGNAANGRDFPLLPQQPPPVEAAQPLAETIHAHLASSHNALEETSFAGR